MNRRRLLAAAPAGLAALLGGVRDEFSSEIERLGRWQARENGLRGEYLLSEDVIYLNHASIGTIPGAVMRARRRYLEICETNPWLYMWGGAWEEGREGARRAAAGVLGCAPAELALTHNTTEGFNLLAQGLPLGPGDEVLFSSMNHDGASVCWDYHGARRGYTTRRFQFPVERAAAMGPEDLLEAYEREIGTRTRVLVFPHIDNIVGFRYPIRRLTEMARARGVEFVAVDGAQAVGMIPVDVAASGVDFYSTSPHKWLQTPKGLGLLYVRDERRADLQPMWVTWGQRRWGDSARMFEDYGTRNLAETLTLSTAVEFQTALGDDARLRRLREIRRHAMQRVDDSSRLVWRSPREWDFSASLFAVESRGLDSRDVLRRLNAEHGFVFRAFHTDAINTMRLSPNLMNDESQVDRFVAAAESL